MRYLFHRGDILRNINRPPVYTFCVVLMPDSSGAVGVEFANILPGVKHLPGDISAHARFIRYHYICLRFSLNLILNESLVRHIEHCHLMEVQKRSAKLLVLN